MRRLHREPDYSATEEKDARFEHAWLLRAEGLSLREISLRLDVSVEQARQMIFTFGRRMQAAMRRPAVVLLFHWFANHDWNDPANALRREIQRARIVLEKRMEQRCPGTDPVTGEYSTAQMLRDEMSGGDPSQPLFD